MQITERSVFALSLQSIFQTIDDKTLCSRPEPVCGNLNVYITGSPSQVPGTVSAVHRRSGLWGNRGSRGVTVISSRKGRVRVLKGKGREERRERGSEGGE